MPAQPAVRAKVAPYENNQGVDVMRSLLMQEIEAVSGGAEVTASVGSCSGVTVKSDSKGFGQALIDVYEGLVDATSHVIERVANALS